MTNLVPPVPNSCGRNSLFISKLLKDKKTGELATFETFFELIGKAARYRTASHPWHKVETYENDRYTLVNNSSGEITDLCRDMFDLINGKEPPKEASILQDTFCHSHLEGLDDVAKYGPRIGARFSMKYGGLF